MKFKHKYDYIINDNQKKYEGMKLKTLKLDDEIKKDWNQINEFAKTSFLEGTRLPSKSELDKEL